MFISITLLSQKRLYVMVFERCAVRLVPLGIMKALNRWQMPRGNYRGQPVGWKAA
jgi:hypothetical protein